MIVKNALIIVIVYFLFQPGMLLHGFTKTLSCLPLWLRKPLFECMICMSSFWGISYFLYKIPPLQWFPTVTVPTLNFSYIGIGLLAEHVLCVGGTMVLLDSFIGFLRRNSGTIREKLL